MIWYEYNMRTGTLSEAKIVSSATLEGKINLDPVTEYDCLYCQALNVGNAQKHFKKQVRFMLKKTGVLIPDEDFKTITWEQVVKFMKKFYLKKIDVN